MNKVATILAGIAALFAVPAKADVEDEIFCLEQNVYFEARNQPVEGMVAVAWVTINRVLSSKYPDTICEVVWQNKQFSWTHDGKSDKPPTRSDVANYKAWNLSGLVVREIIQSLSVGDTSPVEDAVMFHTTDIDPYWTSSYTVVKPIEDHIFYKETE